MIIQKGDTANYLGTAFIIVLFFLFISVFSNRPLNQTSCSYQYVLKSEFSLSHSKAVVIDAIQLPSAQNNCLYILYNENLNLFSETNKIFADNRKINQQIILRQKAELLIKPSLPDRFCFHPVPADNEELPILG